MMIDYIFQTYKNPLYLNEHLLHGRYQAYGQLSFIADFLNSAVRNNLKPRLIVIGHEHSLSEPQLFSKNIEIFYWNGNRPLFFRKGTYLVLDLIDDTFLHKLPENKALSIIHYSKFLYSNLYKQCCYKFICMSKISYERQSKHIDRNKLEIINQGIDLNRYNTNRLAENNLDIRSRRNNEIKILVTGRLEWDRGENLVLLIQKLISLKMTKYEITVLGTGKLYWYLVDNYGDKIIIVNNINQNGMPKFIKNYDIVIGSGRVVYECLALGKSAIVCGENYAGELTPKNFLVSQDGNMTGIYNPSDVNLIESHIYNSLKRKPFTKQFLKKNISIDNFVSRVKKILNEREEKKIINNSGISLEIELSEKKIRNLEIYMNDMKFETNLISQRLGWFIASQSFLFGAYISGFPDKSDFSSFFTCTNESFFGPLLPFFGILLSGILCFLFKLGFNKLRILRRKVKEIVNKYNQFSDVEPYSIYQKSPNKLLAPGYYSIPVSLFIIWLFTFISSICSIFR